ncbi:Calmodulin [Hexamita inflata]|uniref:Calmodulin n=1 Tax=Hexamita inflata TaxID=28002 RepID=A0AA86UM95_9EUKA|nr:Calmodulin [Hexamita inflata]
MGYFNYEEFYWKYSNNSIIDTNDTDWIAKKMKILHFQNKYKCQDKDQAIIQRNNNIKDLIDIFRSIDKNNTGEINSSDLTLVLEKYQYALEWFLDKDLKSIQIVQRICHSINQDFNGKINQKQYLNFMHVFLNADIHDYYSILFYGADKDFSGTLNKKEFNSFLKQNTKFGYIKRFFVSTITMLLHGRKGQLSYEQFLVFTKNNKNKIIGAVVVL